MKRSIGNAKKQSGSVKKQEKIERIINERKQLGAGVTESDRIIKEYCIALSGTVLFGVQIEYLREVFDIRERADIVPIPFIPSYLLGIVNVRGEILPVLSLPEIIGIENDDELHKMIVVDAGKKIAFPVRRILDLVQMEISEIRQIKEAGAASDIRFISGEFTYEGKTVFVIDVLKLFSSKFFDADAYEEEKSVE